MDVAKTYQDRLSVIKDNIKKSYDYFKPNYDRYNEFRKFIFETSLSADDISLLTDLSKPQLEFNIGEAYISRLMGEFSKQEPDIGVNGDEQMNTDPTTIKFVEGHLRHTITDSDNYAVRYELYKEILSGGFSVAKVKTDYLNPMSMDQGIFIEKCFDPTLCGFDLLARLPHKGDADIALNFILNQKMISILNILMCRYRVFHFLVTFQASIGHT